MDFTEACDELVSLLKKSKGKPIPFDDDEERFIPVKTYTIDEITAFEEKHDIKLPEAYRYFLQTVGACELYQHPEYGGGFQVIELEKIKKWSEEYGEDYHRYFPEFLIIINHFSMGDAGAFDLKEQNKFAIVPHDECLEEYMEWQEGWSTFEDWVVKCVESLGNDSL